MIKHLTVDLAHYLLNLDIDPDRLELLQTEQQRIEDRRADLVARAVDQATGHEFILHIEIQNDNQTNMPLRMLRYYTDIRLNYPENELRQFLVYIGRPTLTMAAGIDTTTGLSTCTTWIAKTCWYKTARMHWYWLSYVISKGDQLSRW